MTISIKPVGLEVPTYEILFCLCSSNLMERSTPTTDSLLSGPIISIILIFNGFWPPDFEPEFRSFYIETSVFEINVDYVKRGTMISMISI